jgi:hypothetical protein
MQHNVSILFENTPEGTLRWGKLFCCEIIELIDEEELFILIAVGKVRVLNNNNLITKLKILKLVK